MINLEPKHAGELPQAKVGVDYTSDSQIGTTLDAGRRYGDSDQFGARVNLVHREGETGIPNDRRRTTLLYRLDYKGDRFRISEENLPRQPDQRQYFRGGFRAGAAEKRSQLLAEVGLQQYRKRIWDVAQRVRHHRRLDRLYRLGAAHAHEEGIYSAPKLVDKSGKATVSRLDTNRISDSVSGMAGIRGNFNTGFVSHKVNVGYSAMTKNENRVENVGDEG
jgi:iron complex outermembrane receptor protein